MMREFRFTNIECQTGGGLLKGQPGLQRVTEGKTINSLLNVTLLL